MKPITLQQLRSAVGGTLVPTHADPNLEIAFVCTDSRRMDPGCVFVALRGDNFDGHDFIPQAADHGALAAVVDTLPDVIPDGLALVLVENSRKALGKLAKFVRLQMRQTRVIGVAGSNGKTSTKNLIHDALRDARRGSISPKSYNNDIGVPLAIFPADPTQDYLVLEMGTNHHDEIRVLTEIAQPDLVVLTNCTAEHLEGLDDLAGVRRENASVLQGLRPGGTLIVNGDDPALLEAVRPYGVNTITFGFEPTNDLFAVDVETGEEGTRFRLNDSRVEVFVPLLGRHVALNALAAMAVARRLRVPDETVLNGLAHAHCPDMRMQKVDMAGVSLINDAYNANPASMKAALDTMKHLPSEGRKIAVLGDMRELGLASDRYHVEVGQFAATCELDLLACIGPQSRLIAEAAVAGGMALGTVFPFDDVSTAANVIPGWLSAGDLVLLKASRGIHLETVAAAIDADRHAAYAKAAG